MEPADSAWIARAVSSTLPGCPCTLLEKPPSPPAVSFCCVASHVRAATKLAFESGASKRLYMARIAQAVECAAEFMVPGSAEKAPLLADVSDMSWYFHSSVSRLTLLLPAVATWLLFLEAT